MKINKRMISKAIRELDREKRQLEMNEKKLISDIKTMAKKGQMNSVKIMAKDLVRTRKYQSKFLEMKAHLQGVSLQLQTMKSTEAMCRAMKGVTKVMVNMNNKIKMPQMNQIMQEFMKENQQMEMTQEMMGEAMEEAMEDDEADEEQIVAQVLDEIGVELSETLGAAPTGAVSAPAAKAAEVAGVPEEEDLESRLNALKR